MAETEFYQKLMGTSGGRKMLVLAWHALAAECISVARLYAENGRYDIPGMPGSLLRVYDRILEGHLPTISTMGQRVKASDVSGEWPKPEPGPEDGDQPMSVRLQQGQDRIEALLGAVLEMVLQEPQVRTQAKGGRLHADCRLVIDGKEVSGLTVESFSVEYADPDPARARWACSPLPIVRVSIESREAKTCERPDA